MRFLDVIGPGDPGYYELTPDYMPVIIIGAVLVVIATVLIAAVLIKKNKKK